MKIDLLHGDCLEKMKLIPDNSIDLCLTDTPYGTTACKWDSVIPFEPMWEQLKRIVKPSGATCLFGQNPFAASLIMSNIKEYKYSWIWDKHIPRNFINAKIMPMNKYEIIAVFGKGRLNYYPVMEKREKPVKVKNYSKNKDSAYKMNRDGSDQDYRIYTHKNPSDIITGFWEKNTGKLHPTQKPVSLLEYLIKTYTLENETVLDFTMGSGSTGVAAKNLKRNFIGIEQDDKYFEIAKDRIEKNAHV